CTKPHGRDHTWFCRAAEAKWRNSGSGSVVADRDRLLPGDVRHGQSSRECKIKGGAFVRLTFEPNSAAGSLNNPSTAGKANPAALVILAVVQALEGTEQPLGMGHVKAVAVVLHVNDRFTFVGVAVGQVDLDFRPWTPAAVLQRIVDQVRQCIAQQVGIGLDLTQIANLPDDLPIAKLRAKILDDTLNQLAQVDGAFAQIVAAEPCEFHQVVN